MGGGQDPRFIAYESAGARAVFKNWRSGAIALGVIAILLGACSGCLAALVPFALLVPQPAGNAARQRPGDLIAALLMYAALAVGLIWLGIGGIRVRRWVRPLVLTVGTITILVGIFALVILAAMAPLLRASILSNRPASAAPPPPQLIAVMIGIAFGMITLLLVIVPAVYVWFYRNANVKAMLDFYDPTPIWSDRCPLPVLGVAVALGLFALILLLGIPVAVTPAFGTVLSGLPAVGTLLLEVTIALLLARLVFRLRPAGWWGTLVFLLLISISYGLTSVRPDLPELYRRAGYSEQQVAQMRQLQSISRSELIALWLPVPLIEIGYLLYVRRYFAGRGGQAVSPPAQLGPV